ncbi:glycine oxidase ThiO [Rubrivirga sp.]|uniref:glycine oxidase ThiO n=1 Tax=Rubrivirga sp. TaxID=1885344 RepID=UPI003C748069
MSETDIEIAVVGGGVAGLGVAWALAERGRRVVVLEAGETGRGASFAAAGMLAPAAEIGFEELDLYALGRDSVARWPGFAHRLEAASGLEVGYRDEGTLVVADDRDSARALRRLYQFQKEHGAPVEWLSGDQATEIEPLLSPRLPCAVLAPDDHQVDNRAVLHALRRAIEVAGGAIRENAVVQRIEVGETPRVVLEGSVLEVEAVVVAAGVGSGLLGLEPALPIRSVKGQALALRLDPDRGLDLKHVVRGPDAYLVPKADGRLIVGATSEDGVTDSMVTAGGLYRLLEGAVEVVPGVEEMEVLETWAGHRPAARDHGPLLGQSAHPGVFYATGHYRHGVLLAPVTADGLALEVDAFLDGRTETAPLLAPFSPRRFS